jgi:predicted nucleic acid-binding protein
VDASDDDWVKAQAIHRDTGIHHPDCLHAQLALRFECDALVTWNMRDFQKVGGLIRVCTPEDVRPTLFRA